VFKLSLFMEGTIWTRTAEMFYSLPALGEITMLTLGRIGAPVTVIVQPAGSKTVFVLSGPLETYLHTTLSI
jgi:hypothetical protein